MARSMSCELGPEGIRVNTISPGKSFAFKQEKLAHTQLRAHSNRHGLYSLCRLKSNFYIFGQTAAYLDKNTTLEGKWADHNPLRRIGA